MDTKEVQSFLIVFSVVLFSLVATIIFLFVLFQKRKNTLLLEKKDAEKRFEEEIAKTQIEIREEIFKNISWELHDNIGQLVTLAKIQLQSVANSENAQATLSKGLKELRDLSKLINPETIRNIKLYEAMRQEVARLNRLNFIDASLTVEGEKTSLDYKVEIIFFRILQEFISNTIKHARATHLNIVLHYSETDFSVTACDNGQGFDTKKTNFTGIGLANMKNRAKLVNAKLNLNSTKNKGTRLTIIYPYKSHENI